jgi:hypothetical protein
MSDRNSYLSQLVKNLVDLKADLDCGFRDKDGKLYKAVQKAGIALIQECQRIGAPEPPNCFSDLAPWIMQLREWEDTQSPKKAKTKAKAKVGRRPTHSTTVKKIAQKWKAEGKKLDVIFARCQRIYPNEPMPSDLDAFRRWLNR